MLTPRTSFVSSEDQVEVAVHDYGGKGHPTIFIHGTGLISRMWEPVIARLGKEFRALCVDLRAHGATANPQNVTFFEDRMVADVVSVIDAFELQNAWVVGHSMGGATGLLASLARPTAFERAWVYEPIIFERTEDRPDGAFDFVEATKHRRSVFPSRNDALTRYGSRPPLNELHPECLEAYVTHGFVDLADGSVELACDPILESRAFEQFLQNGWERLPQITIDALIAYGARGVDRPSTTAPAIASRLPFGVAEQFQDSDHFGCFGSLQSVVTSLRRWFLDADSRT